MMPKGGRGGGDVWDSVYGIYRIDKIHDQANKDAEEYGLTPQEAQELESAYLREDSEGVMADANRRVVNWVNEKIGGGARTIRSSDEILDAAKSRNEGGDVSPTDPTSSQYAPDSRFRKQKLPSMLDYYRIKF